MPTKKKSVRPPHLPDHLIVVAHPDDEALFFSGLILSQKKKWHVICVTDGNADGQGEARAQQFEAAAKALKLTRHEMWDFQDTFESRLPVNDLIGRLNSLPRYKKVFTHGITGEYGHPHHQDVSLAVHTAFKGRATIYSTSYNIFPDIKVQLTPAQFALKTKILWEVYGSEIQRFVNFIPATWSEGFSKVALSEVFSIYAWLVGERPIPAGALKKYKWLGPWLQEGGGKLYKRPF